MSQSQSQTPLRDRVFREADTRDIDIDSVEHIDTESEGTTVRVLYKDAPDEENQVGFQVTKPPGPMGDQMLGEQLANGFRELRDYIRNDRTDGSDNTEDTPADADDDTEQTLSDDEIDEIVEETTSTSTDTAEPGVGEIQHTVTLETTLADADHETIRTALSELIDEVQQKDERIDELSDELAETNERLDKLENAMANIGSGLSVLQDEDG